MRDVLRQKISDSLAVLPPPLTWKHNKIETLDHMLVVESNPKKKIGFTAKERIRKYGRKRQSLQ